MGEDDIKDNKFENFVKSKVKLTSIPPIQYKDLDTDLIKKSLKGHFVFYNLSSDGIDNLIQKMFYCTS